jgi:hypothetical protein
MEVLDNYFWVPFAALAAFFLYRILKHGSLRGMLYGSAVARTIGEVDLGRRMGATTTLRIHVLENGQIVLEQSSRAALGASLSGMPLSTAEADRLIALLQQARA